MTQKCTAKSSILKWDLIGNILADGGSDSGSGGIDTSKYIKGSCDCHSGSGMNYNFHGCIVTCTSGGSDDCTAGKYTAGSC